MTETVKVSQALKPCPFCGGETVAFDGADGLYWAECTCGARGPIASLHTPPALERWNTRHESQLLLVEALENLVSFAEAGALPGAAYIDDARKALATIRGDAS